MLKITEILNKKTAILHSDGLIIYELLKSKYNQNEEVDISFEGLEHCTSAFINASIGKFLLEVEHPEVALAKINFLGLESHFAWKIKIEDTIKYSVDPSLRDATQKIFESHAFA